MGNDPSDPADFPGVTRDAVDFVRRARDADQVNNAVDRFNDVIDRMDRTIGRDPGAQFGGNPAVARRVQDTFGWADMDFVDNRLDRGDFPSEADRVGLSSAVSTNPAIKARPS